jgi:hypothetical protein
MTDSDLCGLGRLIGGNPYRPVPLPLLEPGFLYFLRFPYLKPLICAGQFGGL